MILSGSQTFSDDFRRNRIKLMQLYSFNIKNTIWRWSLILSCLSCQIWSITFPKLITSPTPNRVDTVRDNQGEKKSIFEKCQWIFWGILKSRKYFHQILCVCSGAEIIGIYIYLRKNELISQNLHKNPVSYWSSVMLCSTKLWCIDNWVY